MALTLEDIVKQFEFWFRLGLFLHEVIKTSLYNVLHNINADPLYKGLPTIPANLYKELDQKHRKNFDKLLQKGIISREQYLLIFPTSLQTDSSKFDVTLLVVLIRNCLNIPAPLNGWNDKNPPIQDRSVAANSIRAREWRNFCHHTDPESIDINLFTTKWNEGVQIVKALGYTVDVSALQTVSLDVSRLSVLQSSMNLFNTQQTRLLKQVDDLQNEVDQNKTEIKDQLKLQIQTIQTDIDKLKQYFEKCLRNETDITQLNFNMEIGYTDIKMMKEEMQNMNNKLTKLSKDVLSQLILPEVTSLTCGLIGTRWNDLAKMIDVDEDTIITMDELDISTKEKMEKCFQLKKNEITWKKLKQDLTNLGGCDHIINKLKSATLLTAGLRDASLELKRLYIKELMNWMIKQPLKSSKDEYLRCVSREEAYIQLAIFNALEIDNDWSRSDREYHMQNSHVERNSIEMHEVFTSTDEFVIVRGIAGIGKSTMIDTFVLKWAKSCLLDGNNNSSKIDFLFKLTCREVNTFTDIKSAESLLSNMYPSVFNKVSIEDLHDISDRVLIIIDGIDELKDVDKLRYKKFSSNLHSIYNLLDVNWHLLDGHKVIVAGRPNACKIVKEIYHGQIRIMVKSVEVCGFSLNSINNYIDKYFKDEDELAKEVKEKIKDSENLALMSTIPVYIWAICGIFCSGIAIEAPKTTAQLCSYSCLIFIRNHLKTFADDKDFTTLSLADLTKDIRVLNILYSLGKLSLSMLTQNKVLFTEDEINQFKTCIELDKTGFLCKSQRGEEKPIYQFRHLVLQEYLASLYIFLNPRRGKSYLNTQSLSCCLPMVAGLYGIHNSINSSYLRDFLNNIQECLNSTFFKRLMFMMSYFDPLTLIRDRLLENVNHKGLLINESMSDVLSSIYEYQGDLPDYICQVFSENAVSIVNIFLHQDLQNLFYLLGKIWIDEIKQISVENVDNQKLPNIMINLLILYWKQKTSIKLINKHKKISFINGTSIKIHAKPNQNENMLLLSIPYDDKSFKTHGILMQSLFFDTTVLTEMFTDEDTLLHRLEHLLKICPYNPDHLHICHDGMRESVLQLTLHGDWKCSMTVSDIVLKNATETDIIDILSMFENIVMTVFSSSYKLIERLLCESRLIKNINLKCTPDLPDKEFPISLTQTKYLISRNKNYNIFLCIYNYQHNNRLNGSNVEDYQIIVFQGKINLFMLYGSDFGKHISDKQSEIYELLNIFSLIYTEDACVYNLLQNSVFQDKLTDMDAWDALSSDFVIVDRHAVPTFL